MKVTEHIKAAKDTLFSFEILPPLKGKGIQTLYDGIDPLMEFNPKFVNVTYHREEFIYKERDNGLLEKIAVRKVELRKVGGSKLDLIRRKRRMH